MNSQAFITALALPSRQLAPCLTSNLINKPLRHVRRRSARAAFSMQEGDPAQDEAPSDTYVPAAEATQSVEPASEHSKRTDLIARLLQLAALTSRGQSASESQLSAMDDLVMSLEELNPYPSPVETDLIDGTWALVFSSAKLFKSNPFLLPGATPLLQVGQIRQRIAVDDGKLETEVDVVAFPVTTGTLKTTARLTPVGSERLEFTVETTTVTGGKIADRLDLGGVSFDIPVEQILTRLRNTTPEAYIDTYYLDEKLRISRSKRGTLYIYTRLD